MNKMNSDNLQNAIADCLVYFRFSGLNEDIIRDIAHDRKISFKILLKKWKEFLNGE